MKKLKNTGKVQDLRSFGSTGPTGPQGPTGPPGPGDVPFSKTLGAGLTATIPPAEHGLANLRNALVLVPTTRAEMDVYKELKADKTVYISSNVELLNHILIVY